MDIDTQVNGIVQNIVLELTGKIQAQVTEIVTQKIDEVIGTIDYNTILSNKLSQRLDDRLAQLSMDKNSIETVLTARVEELAKNLSATTQQNAKEVIKNTVENYVATIDFQHLYQSTIVNAMQTQGIDFPKNSISSDSINLSGFVISGDHVLGGIIKKFGSTGIDDQAENCQLTIMDDVTVVENNLLTRDLTVKGNTHIEGNLIVTGTLPEDSPLYLNIVESTSTAVRNSLDTVVFQNYADLVTNTIRDNGLDLNKITINGKEVITGDSLSNFVVSSNLQKLGLLKELQVSGEGFLSETLYTTRGRVGINTIEPNSALSIWDQEVEVSVSKSSTDTAILETPRNQNLILSSNRKNNLTLKTDGSVSVTKLNFNEIGISFGYAPPSDTQPRGSIVFNASPSLGGPMGWVSLGDAKWANFGIID